MLLTARAAPMLACLTVTVAAATFLAPGPLVPTASAADVEAAGHAVAAPASGLVMAQLTPHRVYQRTAKTGGGAGRGFGKIDVPITLAAPAASIECRLRDAAAPGHPVLKAWAMAATAVPASTTSVACADVPADQKQYLVDLRTNADDAEIALGTSPVMMGRVIVHWGQSQAHQFVTSAGTSAVLAPATSSVLRLGKWSPIPANSLGLNAFLQMEGLANRVAVGVVTHAVDNSVVASWLPATGTNYPGLVAQVDLAGGFEAMDEYIGGSDLKVATTPEAFANAKRTIIRDLQDRHNPIWGRETELVLSATTVRQANDVDHASAVEAQQAAERQLAVELGGAFYEGWDIDMMAGDSVHHNATGNPAYGYGLSRAFTALRTRGALAAGPTVRSATMSGASITLALDMPPASGPLTLTGDPTPRFTAFPAGTTSPSLKIASVSVAGSKIVLAMATPPKGDVDIWLHRYPDPSPTLAGSVIRDSYTADGAPYGRLVEPTVGPVTADNPVQAIIASAKTPSADTLVAQP